MNKDRIYHELSTSSAGIGAVFFAAGGITFHIWREQMLRLLELALRFRAVIVSVSTSEKPHASTELFFFSFFFFALP